MKHKAYKGNCDKCGRKFLYRELVGIKNKSKEENMPLQILCRQCAFASIPQRLYATVRAAFELSRLPLDYNPRQKNKSIFDIE